MNRVRIMFVLIMSLIVGGLALQGSGVAGPKDTWGPPPAPPNAPLPPPPPMARRTGGKGISISIRNNKIHIDGLEQLVSAHLAAAEQMLRNSPNVPQDVRDKVLARMAAVRGIVDKNLKTLSSTDIDKLDDQLEKMGDELEKAMEGLDADLAQLGDSIGKKVAKDLAKRFGKDFAKGFSKKGFQFHWNGSDDDQATKHDDKDINTADADTEHDTDTDTDSDVHADDADQDVTAAIDDLKNFALKPSQKDAIAKLRATSDAKVAVARKQLDEVSKKLEAALADVNVSDTDVTLYVDQISTNEAAIRKARLLAWVAARHVLDADQIKKLEAAAHKTP